MVQRLLLANDLPYVGKVALATSIPIAADLSGRNDSFTNGITFFSYGWFSRCCR